MRILLPLIALLVPTSFAVFADEAYQIDYHHALLGLPQEDNTFVHQPVATSKASLIYTLSDKGLLGAVNPKDGSIVWRQQVSLGVNTLAAVLRPCHEQDVVATGTDSQVAAWTASDGRLMWSEQLEEEGQIKDIKFLELGEDGSTVGVRDVLVLFSGSQVTVQRRDGTTGELKWQYIDSGADAPHRLGLTGSTVHLISLHGTILGGHKIKVTDIDAVSGQKTEQHTLSDSDVAASEDIIFVGPGTAVPILVWTDTAFKATKVNILGTNKVLTLPTDKKGEDLESIKIHAPNRLNSLAHFLVQYTSKESHWAEVYHLDLKKPAIAKAYDLPKLAGNGAFAASVSDANVFFTRVAKGALTVTSSASHGVVERYMLSSFVPGVFGAPEPVHAVSEVVPRPDGGRAAVRTAVLLSSGDWILILNGQLAWSRPEALTLAESVVFAELPHAEKLAKQLAIEEHASMPVAYLHRLMRHLQDLKQLPAWLKEQPARVLASFSGKEVAGGLAQKADKFGFHKLVIVATSNGRIIAVDTASGGQVAWNQPVPNFTEASEWQVPTLRASAPGIIRVKNAGGHWVYDTSNGNLLREGTESKKDKSGTIIKYGNVNGVVEGFTGEVSNTPIWTFKPKEGERILNVVSRPSSDPVSSIGVVLGDRRVLYKYLNPNLALIITVSDASSTAFAYLLDSVSGNLLYEAKHTGVDVTRPIASIISENWLTYTFTLKSGPITSARGHVLVTAHLYESELPDDRGVLGGNSSYSALNPLAADIGTPYIISQSYQIPEEVSSLSVSQTRQGITSRMLLAVLPESASIIGIPLGVVDPRRPIGRDPTANEQMEGLARYAPVIEFNPTWYLNHKRDVVGVKNIVTSPAVLESTSLVFAYGLDVFGTRVTPSFSFDVLGKEFNKVQMLATVGALLVGVVFVAPWVKRKQINMRWQI